MRINELARIAHAHEHEHGWCRGDHYDTSCVPRLLMLAVSELSEALEEYRNGHHVTEVYFNPDNPMKPEGFPVEIADALIRLLGTCDRFEINIESVIELKMQYNRTRGHRHGGKVC